MSRFRNSLFLAKLFFSLPIILLGCLLAVEASAGVGGRVTSDLQALYLFGEGSGQKVYDISGTSASQDLTIEDSSAVSWLPGGGLYIGSATQLRSGVAPSEFISSVKTNGALTVEAWVKPASLTQSGPARIVSLSQDTSNRDFTLSQSASAYDIRLRTTETSENGLPSVTTPSGVVEAALQHIVYTRDASGVVAVYVDGVLVMDSAVSGVATNWNESYELVLANERSGDRPWLGELHLVALYDRALTGVEVAQNHAADPDLLDTITYPPQISPAAGDIVKEVHVTLTSLTAGATIYYSLDGSTTPSAMTPYTGPFTLTSDATVTTVAVKTGLQQSVPKSAHYTVIPFTGRTTAGLQVFYNFTQGSGQEVLDLSGVGVPLNLDIVDSSAVSWLPGGGITINSATQLRSGVAANKLTSAVTASSALTIEAWVKPANITQSGPSRIVSLSQDLYNRDFTLGQSASAYDIRLRTTDTSINGLPSVTTPSGMVKNALQHIVYTRDATGAMATYVDGLLVMDSVVAGTLTNWDDSYELVLANELTGDRPWLGDLHLIALYDRALSAAELAQNLAAGPHNGANQPDMTLPTITTTIAPAPNAAGWHSSDVTISFTCTNVDSGIADCPAPVTVTAEGAAQVVSGTATDIAGNSATTSVTINLDKFDPTISATKTPLANINGWNNSDVTISFTCADSGSGIATCPASAQLSTEGAGQIISGTATDLSGKSTTASTEVSIDKMPPEIIATIMPVANSAGWHNSDVELSFSCNDEPGGSGTTACPLARIVTTEGAGQLKSGSVLDLAGNSGTDSVMLNIDKTAPTVQIDAPLNGSFVTEPSVTVSGVISEVNSLVSLTVNGSSIMPDGNGNFSYTVALVEGINTISVWATDIADNNTNESLNVTYNPPLIADFLALTVGSGSGSPGDVIQIPINFVSDGTVAALQTDIQFDVSQLTAGLPIAGAVLNAHGLQTAQPQAGILRIVITPPPDNAPLATGVLAMIPFTVNTSAINSSELLMIGNSVMADGAAAEVAPDTLGSGLIAITGAP